MRAEGVFAAGTTKPVTSGATRTHRCCMLHEHDIGRTHVRNMKQYLAVGDIPSLRNESLQYVDLLRQHILKEDSVLFPMGLGTLSHEELKRLGTSFQSARRVACSTRRNYYPTPS